MLFEVWECCVFELCCAVSGVRVFCIRVVLYCFRCEGVLCLCCAVWGVRVLCIWVVLCCFRCEGVLYQSCAVLFQVWGCFVFVLCCLRCESVVYLSCAVLFQAWGCFFYQSCAVLFQVWGCFVSELCCAVSGVADQRGPVGNNSSQLPWDYDYRVSMAALQSQPHANSVCGAIICDEEYHPVEGTSGLNSFIPENCYSGWENLSLHSWEPLERGRHKHSLPSGRPLQRFCLWNPRLSVTWSARQFPLASVTGPEECFDKPDNALISRAWPLPECGKVSSAENLSISRDGVMLFCWVGKMAADEYNDSDQFSDMFMTIWAKIILICLNWQKRREQSI